MVSDGLPAGLFLAVVYAHQTANPDEQEAELQRLKRRYGLEASAEELARLKDAVVTWVDLLPADTLAEWDPKLVHRLQMFPEPVAPDTARLLLRDWINRGLDDNAVAARVDSDLNFVGRALRPMGELWLQLLDAIQSPRPWKRCEHCGMPFPVRRRGAGRFCSVACRVGAHNRAKRTTAKTKRRK